MGRRTESMPFKDMGQGLEKIHEKKKEKGLPEHDEAMKAEDEFYAPLKPTDHLLALRQQIQELEEDTPEVAQAEQETTKRLKELITPELLAGFSIIKTQFRERALKHEDHPQREYIDIEDKELNENIQAWIDSLVVELKKNKDTITKKDIQEIEANSWLLFDSMANVVNTCSIRSDIKEYYEENPTDIVVKEKDIKKIDQALLDDLGKRYPVSKEEMKILVDLVQHEGEEDYNFKILAETLKNIYEQYNLGEHKKELAKISLGYLASEATGGFAPYLFSNLIGKNGYFMILTYLEYMGLSQVSDISDAYASVKLANLGTEVSQQINERITNSLFFQEFEFVHDRGSGEIYRTMINGKEATQDLMRDAARDFVPIMTGAAFSLSFLTKIHPVLGGLGLAGMPVMFRIAKKQNEKILRMRKKERTEEGEIATHVDQTLRGFETIKTSSSVPEASKTMKEKMNIQDKLSLKRTKEYIKTDLLHRIPHDLSTVFALLAGGVLQRAGAISGGAILSNVIYSDRLRHRMQHAIRLYYNHFSQYVQDIKKMEKVFGKYDELDLPEGEKEKMRKSIDEIKDFSIKIKDLNYKEILKDVNLEIPQGEFFVIAGESGGGRTTLLRNIVGLYQKEKGEIFIGGVNTEEIKRHGPDSLFSKLAYCSQKPQIFPEMTLRENLLLWSGQDVDDRQIKDVLKRLHLDKFEKELDKKIDHFSGGELVRIGVARTLLKDPKILLLDEPTASLDSGSAREVRKIIQEIHETNPDITIVCVSHDEEMFKIGDRVMAIEEINQNNSQKK